MDNLKDILMIRDNLTEPEADELIEEARTQLQEYLDEDNIEAAYEICSEYFGLEPDYIMELL